VAAQARLTGNKPQKLIEFASQYRSEIRAGLAVRQAPPKTPKDAKRHFAIKHTAVETLVDRIDVLPGRTLRVTFRLDSRPERQPRNSPTGSRVPDPHSLTITL
jgi:hypothetical protein